MPRKKLSRHEYFKRKNKLVKFGFNLSFGRGSDDTRYTRAAISRAWNRSIYYIAHPQRNRTEFIRFRSRRGRKSWGVYVPKARIMPGGVFLQRPANVEKGDWKVRRNRDGTLSELSKKGKIRDLIVRLDATKFALNPSEHLLEKLKGRKRPKQFILTVNGWDSVSQGAFNDLKSLNRYVETSLVPRLHNAQFNFEKYGKEVFGVKLVYTMGGKKAPGEGKPIKENIFHEFDKRIYGRKKFINRQTWQLKTGKKKGT